MIPGSPIRRRRSVSTSPQGNGPPPGPGFDFGLEPIKQKPRQEGQGFVSNRVIGDYLLISTARQIFPSIPDNYLAVHQSHPVDLARGFKAAIAFPPHKRDTRTQPGRNGDHIKFTITIKIGDCGTLTIDAE